MAKKNIPRDESKLSRKPLSETLEPSPVLHTNPEPWVTSPDLTENGLSFIPKVVEEMAYFLVANPNQSSSWLFRADILYDSEGSLCTPPEIEQQQQEANPTASNEAGNQDSNSHVDPVPAREVEGFTLTRTIVRKLIPRKPKLDPALDQTCHFYQSKSLTADGASYTRFLTIYTPHISSKEEIPFYHPVLRSLAFLYDYEGREAPSTREAGAESVGTGTMSIHVLLYSDEPIHNRLERTLQMLLSVQIRIAKGTRLTETLEVANHNPIKDNIIPQHLVQNTYTRLKSKYGAHLCEKWVESTDPTKHVFEDLCVTAFLIELWRSMYGCVPEDEKKQPESKTEPEGNTQLIGSNFPGFVDVACGNGVLVYVLLQEGYSGWGFDARRRKTWSIFPDFVQNRLKEEIYIPKPFADELGLSFSSSSSTNPSTFSSGELDLDLGPNLKSHTGTFPKDTFIISNHADELTLWTPLMAALLSPASPSPFLAIPCCSHSLSGARYRYPPPSHLPKTSPDPTETTPSSNMHSTDEPQPATGDLNALRKAKQDASNPDSSGFSKSMYGSLAAKTVSVAEELGYEVEKTLLRIPSTRNMGVLGGRRRTAEEWRWRRRPLDTTTTTIVNEREQDGEEEEVLGRVKEVVRRECMRDGGVGLAAKIWVERAKGLNKGQGSGAQHGK